MKRLVRSFAIVVAASGVANAATTTESAENSPPNILFVPIDDLNDWVGCLKSHPLVKTPNIDRLAASGTLFTNAHCQAPLCNPSRTSVLTGLRPSTTGVYSLDSWFRDSRDLRDIQTLPQKLSRAAGYHTAIAGKVFHVEPPKDQRENEFDDWGYRGFFGPLPEEPFVETIPKAPVPFLTMYGKVTGVDWGVFPERDELQEDSKVIDWTEQKLDSLAKSDSAPFFVACGIRHPHLPFFVTQKWYDLYRPSRDLLPPLLVDDRSDVPLFAWSLHWNVPAPRRAWLEERQQLVSKVHLYLASISYADHLVGRLMEKLESSGLAENTIVVLWSDHGYHLGEKEITGKNTLWERSTRVPLIIAGPGISSGGVCDDAVELLDLYPTILELAGVEVDNHLEGQSLVPQLRDAAIRRTRPAVTTHGPGSHSVRTNRWRFIQYANGDEELYNSQDDPNEWDNLASDSAYDSIKVELAAHLPKKNVPPIVGSRLRLVEFRDGKAFWEDSPANVNGAIPASYTPKLRFRTKRIGAIAAISVLAGGVCFYRRLRPRRRSTLSTEN